MMIVRGTAISSLVLFAILLVGLVGCGERKPPFSMAEFETAEQKCGATDAYVIDAAPNTIGFRGTAEEHLEQARCIETRLAGTDVQTVVLGSQLHER